MAVVGLALYGSHARQDDDEAADVDLLAVTTDGKPATAVYNQLTISRCPFGAIIRHARRGDLFALHIVSEARVIYEAWPVFEEIRRAFRYRADYTREIRLASDVGWFLARYSDRFDDERFFNQKMAWCTRTIVIAKAASIRSPIFSAKQLAEFCGSGDVAIIVKNKTGPVVDADIVGRFREFLRAFGAAEPPMPPTLNDQRRIFEADRNTAGMGAMRALLKQPPLMVEASLRSRGTA